VYEFLQILNPELAIEINSIKLWLHICHRSRYGFAKIVFSLLRFAIPMHYLGLFSFGLGLHFTTLDF
jgi:hypothetical protein